MKSILGVIGTFIIIILLYYFLIRGVFKEVEKEEYKYKSQVGKMVVIGKDTLQILDYSTWNENFTLSNGTTVSYDYVEKQLLTIK